MPLPAAISRSQKLGVRWPPPTAGILGGRGAHSAGAEPQGPWGGPIQGFGRLERDEWCRRKSGKAKSARAAADFGKTKSGPPPAMSVDEITSNTQEGKRSRFMSFSRWLKYSVATGFISASLVASGCKPKASAPPAGGPHTGYDCHPPSRTNSIDHRVARADFRLPRRGDPPPSERPHPEPPVSGGRQC